MILWYHRKIESKSDESEDDDISPLEDCNDRDVEYLIEGKLLLKVQTKKDDVEQQGRISSRCHINNKVYRMIIYNGSCANVASIMLVRKLNMKTIKCHRPYRL